MNWLRLDWPGLVFTMGGRGGIEIALLVCLFWAALMRPERIRSPLMFRLAGLFLVAALGAHAVVQIFVFGLWMPDIDPKQNNNERISLIILTTTAPLFFTVLALLMGIGSVLPQSRRDSGMPTESTRE
jgi:hypothetical protein